LNQKKCYKLLQSVTGEAIVLKVSELFAAVSPRTQAEKELVDIKDLSLDEIMVCLRELTAELGAVQLDFNQQWSVDQLKDELMVLEFQGLLMRQGDSPIPLIPFKENEELDRISEVPVWLVYLNSPKPDYYWVNRNQLISIYS
jgi:hypothetical protein